MTLLWQEQLVEDARRALPAHVFRYFCAGASEELTLSEAAEAWRAVRFLPRVLRDVREVSLETTLLGSPVSTPIAIAPTSLQRLAHAEGEEAMVDAARRSGALVVVSSNAGTLFETIGAAGATWWLQAYLTADRSLMRPVLERAAAAGAAAVVLTADTPFPGPKYDIDDDAFGDLSQVYGLNHAEVVRGVTRGAEHARDLAPHDLAWIRDLTGLPVVVKGVLHPDDAFRCVDAGAAAVWVSNHGGRQLDRATPTAQALPEVVAAVAGEAEVYVDGGIRSGLDALAALSLGARAAFVGRPALYGLATGGSAGATGVLRQLADELGEALQLAGCASLADTPDLSTSRPQNAR